MKTALLNRLSESKKVLIDRLLDACDDSFEMAACFQEEYRNADINSKRSLKIVTGPNELRHFLNRESPSGNNRNLIDKMSEHRIRKAQSYLDDFKQKIKPEQHRELRKMIFWDLNFQLSQAIYGQISSSSIFSSLYSDFVGLASAGHSFEDADWLGFYEIIDQNFNLEREGESASFRFLINGGFTCFLYGDTNFILKKPKLICRNQNLVLHCEDGPAVKWEDGTCLYFWNGIEVHRKLIELPETITKEDILTERNVEVRRCYQEALGSERFANLLGLTPIDNKSDQFGNAMTLYRTTEKDRLIGEYIHFAKVICPTTGRNYFLCVPPKISSVDEAVAWTFGKKAREYKPERET